MKFSARQPWLGLLAMVVLVPLVVGAIPLFGARLTLNVFVQAKLIVLALALAFTLATWAMTYLKDGTIYTGRSLLPFGVFAVVAALSAAVALDPRQAVFGDSEQGVGLLVFLLCVLVGYLVTQLVRDQKQLAVLTSAVIFTATAVAVVGLLQQLAGLDLTGVIAWGTPGGWMMRRGFGTIGNADTLGAYLVLPSLLAAARFIAADDRRSRLNWGACFVAIVMSCVATQTRGALVGLLVGGVLLAVRARAASRSVATPKRGGKKAAAKQKSPLGLVAAVVAAAVAGGLVLTAVLANGDFAGAWHDFVIRFGSIQSFTALGGRVPLWTAAVQMAAAHPLLGIGPDSFRLGWYPLRTVAHVAGGAGLVITDPHSVPLLLSATMGIAGLLAAAYLLVATIYSGFATAKSVPARGGVSDYEAWLYGTVALSVTLLSSMLASVLLFMLFLGLGVLIAPALRQADSPRWSRATFMGLRAVSVLGAVALLAFGLLGGTAQVTAVGAAGGDAAFAQARLTEATTLAPWDTQLRNMRYEEMVQAALDQVFSNSPGAAALVDSVDKVLAGAARSEPYEYLYPYRRALLLIGSGQQLGKAYTTRGIEAGLEGLRIYPNSLELRTGVATAYLQNSEPQKAADLLAGLWDADAAYPNAGLTYAQALVQLKKYAEARNVLAVLKDRFPDNTAVADLAKQIPSN